MNSAQRESAKRFRINTGAMVLVGLAFFAACALAKPTLDANPQHPIGAILVVGFFVGFTGVIAIYLYVNNMRSHCPQCGKKTALMVAKPPENDLCLECKECGYSEKTGWKWDITP
jgi:hypothetical protein